MYHEETYCYESVLTGQLLRNKKEVVKTIIEDLFEYKILNLRWKKIKPIVIVLED